MQLLGTTTNGDINSGANCEHWRNRLGSPLHCGGGEPVGERQVVEFVQVMGGLGGKRTGERRFDQVLYTKPKACPAALEEPRSLPKPLKGYSQLIFFNCSALPAEIFPGHRPL